MKLDEAKKQFVETWGTLGTNWGINRTMAQIHALMLVTEEPLNTEQVMDKLGISRGNANMNLRALVEWRLIEGRTVLGQRVEHFVAEKDIWKVVTRILTERRKRELDPLKTYLGNLHDIEDRHKKPAEHKAFVKMITDIENFVDTADKITNKLTDSNKGWFFNTLMKFILGKTKP